MTVQLNHLIVYSHDRDASATFLAEMLDLEAPYTWGPFAVVETGNGVDMSYMTIADEVLPQHYAFLISEAEFDAVLARINERGLTYWADPHKTQPDAFNTDDGGRGLYFDDPDGHLLEIITRPYGSGA